MLFIVFSVLIIIYEGFFGSGSENILTQPFSQIMLAGTVDLYMKELASLLNAKNIGRHQELYIRGYIGEHSRICPCPNECPLGLAMRTDKTSLANIDKTQHAYKSLPLLVAHAERLFEFYLESPNGKNAETNIAIARFIISFSKEPTIAIKYLTQARTLKQSLQEQFFIYRYECLLTESFKNRAYLEKGEQINVLNVMKYEKYQLEFNELIEQNGLLYMQFWSTLLDESPSMAKVCEIGFKILETNKTIVKRWGKIQAIFANNPKDLNLYAGYLNEVWYDKEVGSMILEKAKDSAYITKYTMILSTHLQDISVFSNDGAACVFMSGKKTNIGEITNCNLAFCRFFGYSKKDLVGRGVNCLMPKLIAEHHNAFIQKNLDSINISCCNVAGSDVPTFGMTQSKYIFPISIKLQSTPNLLNEMHYIAKVKIDKKHISNNIAFLLLNKKREVNAITSSCLNLLNISNSTLNYYTIDMSVIAPDLFKKDLFQNFVQKAGGRIKVYHPTYEHRQRADEAVFKDDMEMLTKADEGTSFHCKLQELSYEPVGRIGYCLMLESLLQPVNITTFAKSHRAAQFQFSFNEGLHIYVRELREDDNSANVLGSGSFSHQISDYSQESGFSKGGALTARRRDLSEISAEKFRMMSMNSKIPSANKHKSVGKSMHNMKTSKDKHDTDQATVDNPFEIEGEGLRRKNTFVSVYSEMSSKQAKPKHSSYYEALLPKYKHLSKFVVDDAGTRNLVNIIENQVMFGEGVRTYRLINGEYVEIFEDSYSQLLAKEIDTPQLFATEGRRNVEKKKQEEIKVIKSRIRTKNDLKKLIDETPYPISVNIIKPFTLICIAILSVLLIAEYLYTRFRLQDILSATNSLGYAFSLFQTMMNLWYDSRELFLINGNNYTVYYQVYPSTNQYMTFLQSRIDQNSYNADKLVEKLLDNTFDFSQHNKDFLELPNISIYLYSNNGVLQVANYTIYQAILINIESFTRIGKLTVPEFSNNFWLLYTAIDTLFSSILENTDLIIDVYIDLLNQLSITSDVIDYLILSFSAFDLLLCLVVGWILSGFIDKYESKIMHIFLEVPRKYVITLNSQCENFVSELQNTEKKNQLEEDEDDDEKAADENSAMISLKDTKGGYERIYTQKKRLGTNFLISYIVIMIIAQAYFVLQFILRSQFYSNVNSFITIYDNAYGDIVDYFEDLNTYREFYNDPNTNLGRVKSLKKMALKEWEEIYRIQRQTLKYNPASSNLLSTEFKNQILDYQSKNLCSYSQFTKNMRNQSQCEIIANRTATLVKSKKELIGIGKLESVYDKTISTVAL